MNFVLVILSEELIKLTLNKSYDLRFSQPSCNRPFIVVIINNICEIIMVLVDIDIIVVHAFSHFSHPPPPHLIEFIFIHVLIVLSIE